MAINTESKESLLWVLGGGALAAWGLSRRGLGGSLLTLAGGVLAACGVARYCGGNKGVEGTFEVHHGIVVQHGVTVERPCAEVFAFWRDFENLPRFMDHLDAVQVLDERNSRWTARAPLGTTVEWDALIVDEVPDSLIAWRSLPESDVHTTGVVRFAAEGESTRLDVQLQYDPPGGRLGAVVAKLMGVDPQRQVAEDLRRFKEIMEADIMAAPEESTPPRTPGQAEGTPEGVDQSREGPSPDHPPDQAEGDLETVEEALENRENH